MYLYLQVKEQELEKERATLSSPFGRSMLFRTPSSKLKHCRLINGLLVIVSSKLLMLCFLPPSGLDRNVKANRSWMYTIKISCTHLSYFFTSQIEQNYNHNLCHRMQPVIRLSWFLGAQFFSWQNKDCFTFLISLKAHPYITILQ